MRGGAAIAAALLVVVISPPRASTRTIVQPEQSLLDAINEIRADHHLRPLVRDVRLDRWARAHSYDMIRERYFGHSPHLERLPGHVVGENLAWCSSWLRIHAIIAAWLASPEHRANLLRPGFERIGIGVAIGQLAGVKNSRVVTVDFSGQ